MGVVWRAHHMVTDKPVALNMRLSSASLLLTACSDDPESLPPVGNHQLFIDTDAIVPPPLGVAAASGAPSLFDRLEVAFIDERGDIACDACSREFSVTLDTFAQGGASLARERFRVGLVRRIDVSPRRLEAAARPRSPCRLLRPSTSPRRTGTLTTRCARARCTLDSRQTSWQATFVPIG